MAVVKKGVKKSFFEVQAPLTGSKISVYCTSLEELDGKTVILDMSRNLRGKNVELIYKLRFVEGAIVAEPIRLVVVGSYIRRAMRRGSDYVEDSFSVVCRDGNAVIKPFMITRKKVSRAVQQALRLGTREQLESYCKIRTRQELFSDIMAGKLQKELSLKLKKIYPLAFCEIRVFELVKEKNVIV